MFPKFITLLSVLRGIYYLSSKNQCDNYSNLTTTNNAATLIFKIDHCTMHLSVATNEGVARVILQTK